MIQKIKTFLFGTSPTDQPTLRPTLTNQQLLQKQAIQEQLYLQSPKQKTRTSKLIVVLGANGTGKTTFIKQVCAATRQRILIITPDDTEYNEIDAYGNPLYPMNELRTKDDFMFDGVCRHIFDPQWTMRVLHNFKCGIIIFDDCRAYFPARTEQVIHELMIRRRQREVDMFAVGHGFTEVPPKFFTFATDYVLFRTEDSIDTRKPYIRSFEKVKKMQTHVNRIAISNPHYHKRMKQ